MHKIVSGCLAALLILPKSWPNHAQPRKVLKILVNIKAFGSELVGFFSLTDRFGQFGCQIRTNFSSLTKLGKCNLETFVPDQKISPKKFLSMIYQKILHNLKNVKEEFFLLFIASLLPNLLKVAPGWKIFQENYIFCINFFENLEFSSEGQYSDRLPYFSLSANRNTVSQTDSYHSSFGLQEINKQNMPLSSISVWPICVPGMCRILTHNQIVCCLLFKLDPPGPGHYFHAWCLYVQYNIISGTELQWIFYEDATGYKLSMD